MGDVHKKFQRYRTVSEALGIVRVSSCSVPERGSGRDGPRAALPAD